MEHAREQRMTDDRGAHPKPFDHRTQSPTLRGNPVGKKSRCKIIPHGPVEPGEVPGDVTLPLFFESIDRRDIRSQPGGQRGHCFHGALLSIGIGSFHGMRGFECEPDALDQ